MKITLSTMKAVVAPIAGMCVTDERVTSLINRAIERLVQEGNWVGTLQRFRICTHDKCLTWPRQIESIISYAICGYPGQVRNQWYEFLDGGPGILNDAECYCTQLIDRGQAVAFDDVTGTDKKLAVYCDEDEASGTYIILRFYTNNAELARSTYDGAIINGEKIDLAASAGTYHYTTNYCAAGGLVEVVKTETVGMVRLYEYDTVNLVYKPLAYYDPTETVPSYRRSLIPMTTSEECNRTVDVNAKLAYSPVSEDDDVLMIQSQEAIRLAVQAILKEEKDLATEGAVYWQMAIRILNKQLENWLGHGATVPIRMVGTKVFGAGIPGVR